MEFPELGKHCHNAECKQLDFLPMKCDSCSEIFCKDHFSYDNHRCPEAHRKNVQVPVCPLCNEPVAFKRGELPDIRVSEHIDRDCKSDPATVKRQKIYTNRCNKKGCKTKELVKITCDNCRLTFCLKHRHESDHECAGRTQGGSRSSPAANKAGAAAMHRFQSSQNSQQINSGQARIPQFFSSSSSASNSSSARTTRSSAPPSRASQPPPFRPAAATVNLQPRDLSEDEALARAMSLSLQDSTPSASSPSSTAAAAAWTPSGGAGSGLSEDEMLARAIAASEEEERRRRERNSNQNSNQSSGQDSRSNCSIS